MSESPLCYIRICTHRFDLPKDISFIQINGVSLNRNYCRTKSPQHQPISVAFSGGEIN